MAGNPIPIAALENHIAILAKTGSGKSNAAKTVVEGLLDRGERVCVIDPTGTWYGLRLTPAKKPSPYKIAIFGGAHADLAIAGNHGAALAEVVGTSATSAIIDTRGLTVGDRTRFFTDFAEALLRTNTGALTLVIDEAHLFAPKGKVANPKSGEMLGAANNLVSLGRGIGLRIILISQRPAKLHNDCLAGAETLVAMRALLPHDRQAVRDWIAEQADPERGREIIASLPTLKTGEAWIWSPGLDLLERRSFPLVKTYDSGRPPPPGESGPALEPLDMATITSRLEAVAADVVANDPKRLKAEIARLTRELAAANKRPVPAPIDASAEQIEAARRAGYAEGQAVGIDIALGEAFKALSSVNVDGISVASPSPPPSIPAAKSYAAPPPPRPERKIAPPVASDGTVPHGCARPLAALAGVYPSGLTEAQWATSAGFKRTSGTWRAYKARLTGAGLIERQGDRWTATEAGASAVGDVEMPPPPGPDLARWWAGKLHGTPKIVEALIASWPGWTAREELAAQVGMEPTSGSFRAYLSRLSGPGLIERTPAGIRLTPEVMGS